MKYTLLLVCSFTTHLYAQNVQLHYDFRHTLDPKHTTKNFPNLSFEYFKSQDTGVSSSFMIPGSFLIKVQADLMGEKNNIGKVYMQVSQSARFWKPKVYVHAEYSGGLGITEPREYSYYINNSFSLGISYPFQWKKAWFSTVLCYKLNIFEKPSHDVLYSFYWGKGFWSYKLEIAGTISIWTLNKNLGDDFTVNQSGKRIAFIGEPQFWFNLNDSFSVGSKINLYYHVLTTENLFQVYPTLAIKYKL